MDAKVEKKFSSACEKATDPEKCQDAQLACQMDGTMSIASLRSSLSGGAKLPAYENPADSESCQEFKKQNPEAHEALMRRFDDVARTLSKQ